ncbi:MAG: hypothetical protein KIS67_10715 [Verrucomicrobiae bacterium]|nr:hypothetical protein [Verrucomicrobiae bacterium]
MGLTIGYTFSTRRKLDLGGIKKLLTPLRAKAHALDFEEVGKWVRLGRDCEFIRYRPPGAKRFADCLPPLEGWLFQATPGDGCESMRIGLCRFAGVPGWRLESFCKTQYASRHGWERFLKCHRGVVELLWEAKALDADDAGKAVTGLIFAHPQFERLEAAGVATHGAATRHAAQLVKTLAASGDGNTR